MIFFFNYFTIYRFSSTFLLNLFHNVLFIYVILNILGSFQITSVFVWNNSILVVNPTPVYQL